LIRKKKDLVVIQPLRPFAFRNGSLPIKSMYVSRPFHLERTFCAIPMQE